MVAAVQGVENDMGWGVFWWYAEAVPTPGLPGQIWMDGRFSLFDQNGNLLPAASVYEQFLPTPGDFNDDGFVDAADYTLWRDGFGTVYDDGDYRRLEGKLWHAAAAAALAATSPRLYRSLRRIAMLLLGAPALASGRRCADRADPRTRYALFGMPTIESCLSYSICIV